MAHGNDPLLLIASDIGVIQYEGEAEQSFQRRVAYSAARFWVSAFCLDDGAEGKNGLKRQSINRRLSDWLSNLNSLYPSLDEWFKEGEGITHIYNRLIDVDELVPNDCTDRYLVHAPSLLPIGEGQALITGLYDPSSHTPVCGAKRSNLVVSGLGTLAAYDCPAPPSAPHWWEYDLEQLPWVKTAEYGDMEYASPHHIRWSPGSGIWSEDPIWTEGLAIARIKNDDQTRYFVAREKRGRSSVSEICRQDAYELYFNLRKKVGNPLEAALRRLDSEHAELRAPIELLPGQWGRVLKALIWPCDDIEDTKKSIVRVEASEAIRRILNSSDISIKES